MLNYGTLPTDGYNSLDRSGSIGANSPTNFAGETGNLTQNNYVIFDVVNSILRIPVIDVPDASTGIVTVFSAILQLLPGSADTFELISAIPSGRVASMPGFHDNPIYDATTNVVEFPFAVVDIGIRICP